MTELPTVSLSHLVDEPLILLDIAPSRQFFLAHSRPPVGPHKSPMPHPHYNWCAAVGSAGTSLVAMCEKNFDLSTLLDVIQSTTVTSEMIFLVLLGAEFLMRLSP